MHQTQEMGGARESLLIKTNLIHVFFLNLKLKFKIGIDFFFNLKFASDSGDGRCEGEFTNKNKFNTCFFFFKFEI